MAIAHVPCSVGNGYSTYAPQSGSMSLVLQRLIWCARCSLLGYGKSWIARTLGKSAQQFLMRQDRSHVAAPASGMSGYQGILGQSPVLPLKTQECIRRMIPILEHGTPMSKERWIGHPSIPSRTFKPSQYLMTLPV